MIRKVNIRLAFGLLVAFGLSNCKKDPVEVVEVFDFSEEFSNVAELPELSPTEPEAVTVTAAEVNTPTATTTFLQTLETGVVSDDFSAATAAVAAAVPQATLDAVSAGLTTEVLASLAAGGSLQAELKANIATIIASGALDAYLPTIVLPTVNGAAVSLRKKGTTPDTNLLQSSQEFFLGIADPCGDASVAAWNSAKTVLDAAKASQENAVREAFTQRNTTLGSSLEAANLATNNKWNAAATGTSTAFAPGLLAAPAEYKPVILAILASYLEAINNARTLELNANTSANGIAVPNAQAALDADLAAINAAYNTELAKLTAVAESTGCHNQGGVN